MAGARARAHVVLRQPASLGGRESERQGLAGGKKCPLPWQNPISGSFLKVLVSRTLCLFLLRIGNIKVIIVDDDNKPGALVK